MTPYTPVERVQHIAIIGNGETYYLMTAWRDGTYTRPAAAGLTVQTISDFDYAALGAPKWPTLDAAREAAHGVARLSRR